MKGVNVGLAVAAAGFTFIMYKVKLDPSQGFASNVYRTDWPTLLGGLFCR